ncbi:MAG: hypothetical protein H6726_32400 [Sandaracinaceae bacterium]|nr:hypothetical protein [Sandaracinaceae bacterium]
MSFGGWSSRGTRFALLFVLVCGRTQAGCSGGGGNSGDAGQDATTTSDGSTQDGAQADTGSGTDASADDQGVRDAAAGDGAVDVGTTDAAMGDAGGALDGGSDAGAAADAGADAATSDAGDTDLGMPGAVTTYLARADGRRCPAPACGGFFLSAVNQASTTCADGSSAAECYVAALDWRPSGLGQTDQSRALSATGGFLLEGRLEQRRFGTNGVFGMLLVDSAWIAEWGTAVTPPSTAPFHALARTPLLCLLDPCFNIRADMLNDTATQNVSAADLSMSGASAADQTRGAQALEAGTLRATGTVMTDTVPGPGGFGETYHATQFYVPLPFITRL